MIPETATIWTKERVKADFFRYQKVAGVRKSLQDVEKKKKLEINDDKMWQKLSKDLTNPVLSYIPSFDSLKKFHVKFIYSSNLNALVCWRVYREYY